MSKIRVAVLYGGRSGEHEVSLRSAASVIRELDRSKFEVVPIGIDKEGKWHAPMAELTGRSPEQIPEILGLPKGNEQLNLPAYPTLKGRPELIPISKGVSVGFDVVFPVMHGTFCEDGTLQGLLEMADVPYVGCGVLSSAVGMDKDVAKRLIRDAGLPMVPYFSIKPESWYSSRAEWVSKITKTLGFPVFVKPSNSGSSVGVHKVIEAGGLDAALADAFRYDTKVLIEKAISAREIEFSVLEGKNAGDPPRVSVAGEIAPSHEFYSYEAKYLDENGANLMIPAKLTENEARTAAKLASDIFVALECEGMARVDLFMDKKTGELYFNEINTIPGFTSISMYPKLWEASGLSYSALLTELVELAVARQARKRKLLREYTPSS